jgi:hypothetical protein
VGVKLGHSYSKERRVFGNRVMRRICGPKKEEVKGGWRRLHKEELYNFYASPDIIRVVE